MIILNGIWWALLRAWYGGQFKNTVLGNHRGIQTVVMLVSMLPLFIWNFNNWYSIAIGSALALWVQFQFWSRGHGPAFDIGTDKNPSEGTIDRYDDRWFDKICKKLVPEDLWYTREYDMLWMLLRYTCPMIPLSFISPWYLLCGIVVPFIYDYSWKKFGTWYPGEYAVGFVFGIVTGAVAYV